MDRIKRPRDKDSEHHHKACRAVVSVGAYGDWHHCEACEMSPRRPGRRPRETKCTQIHR